MDEASLRAPLQCSWCLSRLMAAGVQVKALMAVALTDARLTLLDTCVLQQVLCSLSVAQSCRVS